MSLFGLIKNDALPHTLYSIVDGKTVPIESVSDPVFSEKVLGDGIAIIPDSNVVCAPCDGEISMIAETGHALGITAKDGQEVLIHIGFETVAENGKGFKLHVKTGDKVKMGKKLITFDKEYLEGKGYDMTIPMVISNAEALKKIEPVSPGQVKAGDTVIRYEL